MGGGAWWGGAALAVWRRGAETVNWPLDERRPSLGADIGAGAWWGGAGGLAARGRLVP